MKTNLIVFNEGRESIVVSDEEIVNCKVFDFNHNIISDSIYYNKKEEKVFKIITQGSQIDFNGLESEFGVVDVEKLAQDVMDNSPDLVDTDIDMGSYFDGIYEGAKRGFKTNQQLKRFSEEGMKKAYTAGWMNKLNNEHTFIDGFNKIIQSLQQPKIFSIEVEMEIDESIEPISTGNYPHKDDYYYKPKFTNGKLKILRKL